MKLTDMEATFRRVRIMTPKQRMAWALKDSPDLRSGTRREILARLNRQKADSGARKRGKTPAPPRQRRDSDAFRALLKANDVPRLGEYRPMVGYLYSNGSVVSYNPMAMAWYSLDRAISSCFGSASRRLRGTWDAGFHKRGVVVACLMMVVDSRSRIAWRAKIDIPEELSRE